MQSQKKHFNCLKLIFLLVFAFGIIARLFGFFVLPESAYADSLFHLKIIKQAVQTGILATPNVFTPPLYYFTSAIFYSLTGFPVEIPFIRFIPFLIFVFQILLSFALLRKLFQQNFLPGLALIAIFPWLVRYSPVNYVGQFAGLLILLFLYFFLELSTSKKTSLLTVFALAASLSAIALSKANALLLFPFFFLAVITVLAFKAFKQQKLNLQSLKTFTIPLLLFAIITLALTLPWFLISLSAPSISSVSSGIFSGFFSSEKMQGITNALTPQGLFKSYLSFFDFPPETAFSNIPLLSKISYLAAGIIFALIVLPLTFAILFGIFKMLKPEQRSAFNVLVVFSLSLLFAFAIFNSREGFFYIRYLIPVMPLLAIPFVIGFKNSSEKLKLLIMTSLVLFAVFSLALSATSSLYYQSVFKQDSPLYNSIKTLPGGSKIASTNKDRQIEFYTGFQSSTPSKSFSKNPLELYNSLKSEGFSHIAITCYGDSWSENLETIQALEEQGLLEKTFEQDCAKLFGVK